jgi:ribosomal protein S18 acetylase RimI-like enzyme
MGSEENAGISIIRMRPENAGLYNSMPSRFTVTGRLRAFIGDGSFDYTITELYPPHVVKTFPDDPFAPNGRYAVFFAMAGQRCIGQIHVEEYWNGMARIEDIRVDGDFRRKGIGRMLMDAAAAWARENGFPALCLEAQDNNAEACRFYAAYGYTLKGVNFGIYDSTPSRGEAALYWYLSLAN